MRGGYGTWFLVEWDRVYQVVCVLRVKPRAGLSGAMVRGRACNCWDSSGSARAGRTVVEPSVANVEREAESVIEFGSSDHVQASDWSRVESVPTDGDDVVAVDHRILWEAVSLAHFDFGRNPPNPSCDRGASHLSEDCDDGVAGEDTDRSASAFLAEICPDDVIPRYHSGAVSATRRCDASNSSGSGGYFV